MSAEPLSRPLTDGIQVCRGLRMSKENKYFQIRDAGDAVVIQLCPAACDDLDEGFGRAIVQYVDAAQPKQVVVDFTQVARCTSSAIGALIHVQKRLHTWGGHLKLCGMSDNVRDSFHRLHLDRGVFRIFASEAEALADS